MKTKKNLPAPQGSPKIKAAKLIMLVLTAIYPLFMAVMTGSGLIFNRSSYGTKVTVMAALLIISGLAMTAGALLVLPRSSRCSLVSIPLTICGYILCMVILARLSAHADRLGWQASGRYYGTSASDLYKARLLPVVFPSGAALVIALIQYFSLKTPKAAKRGR